MTATFATGFDQLTDWRAGCIRRIDELSRFLAAHDLGDDASVAQLAGLRDRLGNDKLVVAFVAEFSRGKSELINAIFFADTGRRVLPATPGRTTMCPVELAWDASEPPSLRLLPIETRHNGSSLLELRAQPRAWTEVALHIDAPERLAAALQEVTRTRTATRDEARELGFWSDDRPDDNPPTGADGRVELPAWRHALINYPHPLLKQGLVVLDTPGLNAIGAEPELTLSLLPTAHATVFIVGADTGVTKSDLGVWRDHLGSAALTRFVVLNKIDGLADPLAAPGQVAEQIASQHRSTARLLGIGPERVFPLSARQALAGRIGADAAMLATSRLPDLERSLTSELLPRRREVLADAVRETAQQVEAQLGRRLGDQRRHLADQVQELQGLRGKSSAKLRLMLQRVDAEAAEFEECTTRLHAMRTVHARMLAAALAAVSTERLRSEVRHALAEMTGSLLNLGAKRAFASLCARLRATVADAHQRGIEVRDMLAGSYARLNADYGFSLALAKGPATERHVEALATIERSYLQYLGLSQSLRLSNPKFMEQFRRMLMAKLRTVFEGASGELDLWNSRASAQIDAQLRERRRVFQTRREALERIQGASSELELRIAEMASQDQRLLDFLERSRALFDALRAQAGGTPEATAAARAPGRGSAEVAASSDAAASQPVGPQALVHAPA